MAASAQGIATCRRNIAASFESAALHESMKKAFYWEQEEALTLLRLSIRATCWQLSRDQRTLALFV